MATRFLYNEIGFDIRERPHHPQKVRTNYPNYSDSHNGSSGSINKLWLSIRPCLTNVQLERAISLIETQLQLHPLLQPNHNCPVRALTQALDNWTIELGSMPKMFLQVVLSDLFSALLSLGSLTLLGPSRTLFLVQQVVSGLRDKVRCQMIIRHTDYALVLLAATVDVLELLTVIDKVRPFSDHLLSLHQSLPHSISFFPNHRPSSNSEIIITPKTSKKSILLKKHEVSFLMGPQGSRINFIRSSTGCSVKILPPKIEIETHSFIPPRNCPQLILLSGLSESLAACISLIELLLYDYHIG